MNISVLDLFLRLFLCAPKRSALLPVQPVAPKYDSLMNKRNVYSHPTPNKTLPA